MGCDVERMSFSEDFFLESEDNSIDNCNVDLNHICDGMEIDDVNKNNEIEDENTDNLFLIEISNVKIFEEEKPVYEEIKYIPKSSCIAACSSEYKSVREYELLSKKDRILYNRSRLCRNKECVKEKPKFSNNLSNIKEYCCEYCKTRYHNLCRKSSNLKECEIKIKIRKNFENYIDNGKEGIKLEKIREDFIIIIDEYTKTHPRCGKRKIE
jgi:hypothetical protein